MAGAVLSTAPRRLAQWAPRRLKMFGKVTSLFGKKPSSSAPPAGAQLAMPLFSTSEPVSTEAVISKWRELFPGLPALQVEKGGEPQSAVQYALDGRALMAIHIPMPVPKDEALGAVRTSWMWQQPDDSVRQHASHAIVTAPAEGDAISAAWNVARLSAAMLKAGGGVALYWGNGRQVHTPEVVEKFSQGRDTPPVPLWVGVTISGESRSGPFSAATHGLASLGHKEFEVRGTKTSIGGIRTTLLDLALYVLRQGPVLEHGQTFGASADQRWSIRHEPSKLVPGREVIVLGMP